MINGLRHEEDTRSLNSETLRSFSGQSLRAVILKNLETSSKQVRCQIAYKVHNGSYDNLFPVDLFRKIFQNTTERTSK